MKGWQRQQHLQQQWQQPLRQQQLCSHFVRAIPVTTTSITTATTATTSHATAVVFPFCESNLSNNNINNNSNNITSNSSYVPILWEQRQGSHQVVTHVNVLKIWSKKTTTVDDSQHFFEWQQMAGKIVNWWANHYYRLSGNLIFVARAPHPPHF